MKFDVTLTFVLEADDQDAAADIAFDAGQHLLDTFNDDESIGPVMSFTTKERPE